jgi:hypothetical protein
MANIIEVFDVSGLNNPAKVAVRRAAVTAIQVDQPLPNGKFQFTLYTGSQPFSIQTALDLSALVTLIAT